jgi:hypothetical protein
MNTQYFGERYIPSGMAERTDQDTTSPAVSSDPVVDNVTMYETPVHAIPVLETAADVGLVDGLLTDEVPMHEPFDQEIPVVETVEAMDQVDMIADTTPYPARVMSSPVPDKILIAETSSYVEAPASANGGSPAPQLDHEESEHFRALWNEVQGQFVDEPHTAVQQADALVSNVIVQINLMLTNERTSLEGQWKQGNDVSTEDLRKALQHYHAFFNRLVALKQQR